MLAVCSGHLRQPVLQLHRMSAKTLFNLASDMQVLPCSACQSCRKFRPELLDRKDNASKYAGEVLSTN